MQLGPLNNKPQFDRVSELVEDARKTGARIVTGGKQLGVKGYFYEPTIVADISDGQRLVDEEQFGPALPIISYRSVEDAVERANATHYGLSGSVWSADREKAAEIAQQLDCGTAWVNQHLAIAPNLPFGGAKWSGIGVENGPWGLLNFTEIQVVNVSKAKLTRNEGAVQRERHGVIEMRPGECTSLGRFRVQHRDVTRFGVCVVDGDEDPAVGLARSAGARGEDRLHDVVVLRRSPRR
jgi:delta 1-pyrroline-5-carboxylate dehydrogenase